MAAQEKTENEILLDSVDFSYNGKIVLGPVTLAISSGEFVGIIGPNGAGKSTLLRLLCGILKPLKGDVYLHGKSLRSCGARDLAREIAVLPAETFLSFDFTVEEIVRMGRAPHLNFWS